MDVVWIYSGVGCLVGLAVMVSGTMSANSSELDGTLVFLSAVAVALLSVFLWPLTLLLFIWCWWDTRPTEPLDRVGAWETRDIQ